MNSQQTPTPPPAAPDATALVIERLSDANVRIYAHLWGDGKGDRLTVQQYTNIISDITSAITHLTALQARCARLEEDKARLEWLMEYITAHGTNGLQEITWSLYDDEGESLMDRKSVYEDEVADTRFDRAAIDAARTAKEAT